MSSPVRLLVAYDGAPFHGFAENAGVTTVAGELRRVLELVTRAPVELVAAGRTDAGVHAWGQVVSCRLPAETDLDGLLRRVNKLLAPSIAVRAAVATDDTFDARFSALWRHYRYDIWNAATPHPLIAGRSWWVHRPLDVAAMHQAAGHLVGEHDFSSFCRRPKQRLGEPEHSLVREVLLTRWTQPAGDNADERSGERSGESGPWGDLAGRLLRFEIRATAFCHQMVRSIVGTLVDIGGGKIPAEALPGILARRERNAAGQVAPPTGLTLWEVGYPGYPDRAGHVADGSPPAGDG